MDNVKGDQNLKREKRETKILRVNRCQLECWCLELDLRKAYMEKNHLVVQNEGKTGTIFAVSTNTNSIEKNS